MNNVLKSVAAFVALLALVSCQSTSTTGPGTGPGNPGNVARVELGPTAGSVPVGGAIYFQPRAYDSSGNLVTGIGFSFHSGAPGIMKVSGSGTGSAEAVGTASISASVNGKSASTTVTVTPQGTAPAGVTWAPTVPTTFSPVYAFASSTRGTWMVAAGTGHVMTSSNAGDDWTHVADLPTYLNGSRLSTDPGNASIALLLQNQALYRTGDGGHSWTAVDTVTTSYPSMRWVTGSLVLVGNQVSTDAGQTWHTSTYPARSIVIQNGTTTWLSPSRGDLHVSTDDGATWSSLSGAFPTSVTNGSASCSISSSSWGIPGVSPSGVAVLEARLSCSAQYWDVVFRSTDAGATWTKTYVATSATGIDPWSGAGAYVNPADPANVVIVGSSYGTAASTDGGTTWTTATGTSPDSASFDPENPNVVFGRASTHGWISTDKGATWSDTGLYNYDRAPFLTVPGNSSTLYFYDAYSREWHVSTDTGTTWTPITGASTSSNGFQGAVTAVGFLIWNDAGLYEAPIGANVAQRAGLGRGLGTTLDGGLEVHRSKGTSVTVGPAQYSSAPQDGSVNSAPLTQLWTNSFATAVMTQSPSNPQRWYYSDKGALYVSNDDGASTTFVHDLPYGLSPNQLVPSSSNANLVYAATYQGVYRSSDAGKSWHWASTGLQHAAVQALAIDPTNDQVLYAATHVGVYTTTDGGKSWSLASQPFDVNAIEIQHLSITSDGTTLFGATGDHGVVRSLDKAKTWEWDDSGLTTYTTADVLVDPTNANVVYLATNTGVWKSTDKGSSWIRASHTLPYPTTHRLGISTDGQHVYVIGESAFGTLLYAGTPSTDTGAGFATTSIHAK